MAERMVSSLEGGRHHLDAHLCSTGVARVHGDEHAESLVEGDHITIELEGLDVLHDGLLDGKHLLRDHAQHLRGDAAMGEWGGGRSPNSSGDKNGADREF